MLIDGETRKLPDDIELNCPQCGQRCRKTDIKKDNYECPKCFLGFTALIELMWDEKYFTKTKGGYDVC